MVPKYDPEYDPLEHLERLKVGLVRMPLARNSALWLPRHRAVVVDTGLPSAQFHPVLAHECDHAENNDPGGHNPRFEARANLHSALILINPAEWDVLTASTDDYDRICLELGITREQFRAYAANNGFSSTSIDLPSKTERFSKHVFKASELAMR